MQRRAFLTKSAAAAIGAVCLRGSHAETTQPLRALVRPYVRVGAQATYRDLQDPRVAAFLASNFNTLTAGAELKWDALRPTPDSYNFTRADWMVAFAEQHGMRFRGHNLCWNHWLPGWVQRSVTKANAERTLTDHIATVVGRYKGRIDSWDVVNEPLGTWYSAATGQPPRPWLDLIGPAYLDVAFHAAAQADPGALRVLNFDRLEQGSDGERRSALATIEGMVRRGVPIQAVGFESHLTAWDSVENASQDRLIQAIRALGLKILITELDVNDARIAGGIAECDRAVAAAYFDYLTKMVPRMGCEQVVFWTPWDGDDWLDSLHGANFDRADGVPHRAGLVDAAVRPKPAYFAVARALKQVLG
jgi:endo-1,4-beta-xylanase